MFFFDEDDEVDNNIENNYNQKGNLLNNNSTANTNNVNKQTNNPQNQTGNTVGQNKLGQQPQKNLNVQNEDFDAQWQKQSANQQQQQ